MLLQIMDGYLVNVGSQDGRSNLIQFILDSYIYFCQELTDGRPWIKYYQGNGSSKIANANAVWKI